MSIVRPSPYLPALALLLGVASGMAGPTSPFPETTPLRIEEDVIDAGVSSDGTVFLLSLSYPRLTTVDALGHRRSFDLSEVTVPGGLCVHGDGGFCVSDLVEEAVLDYGPDGELLRTWEAGGRPGDVAMVGLSPWYVATDNGSVRMAGRGELVLARLDGNVASISGGPEGAVLVSDSTGYLVLEGGDPRRIASGVVSMALCAGRYATLRPKGLLVLAGDTVAVSESLDRISCSPTGYVLLWESAGNSALVGR
ncbi:hypothetical protein GF402_08745 [Candidatus Fermentibacteria bacterium]|nr:hypothetical protein [Candidatus Fermentibacteria bacterium]